MQDEPTPQNMPLPEAMEGNPGATFYDFGGDDDLTELSGTTVGPGGIAELRHCADRLSVLANSTTGDFAARLRGLVAHLRSLGEELRRRLENDRLSEEAGTPEQRQRIEDERRRREAAADSMGGEPAT